MTFPRVLLILSFASAHAACSNGSPASKSDSPQTVEVRPPSSAPPATAATDAARAALPIKVDPVKVECGAPGYTAKYFSQTRSMPSSVWVTFRGATPTSAAAQRALDRCLRVVAEKQFLATDVMAMAWYSKSGNEDDDETLDLPDGSGYLLYRVASKDVVSQKQSSGEKAPQVVDGPANEYFVSTEINKVLVAPFGNFAQISVVFKAEPSEKRAYEVLISEVRKTVVGQSLRISTTAFAQVGQKGDPAGWQQVKSADGRYIDVTFEPKTGDRMLGHDGRDLGPSGRIDP